MQTEVEDLRIYTPINIGWVFLLYSNILAAAPSEGLSCGYKRKAAMKKDRDGQTFGKKKPHIHMTEWNPVN